MNVEKIKFEQQFENLDISTATMEGSMMSSTAQSMPESQVESLMQQVADEHGLEVSFQLPNSGLNKLGQRVDVKAEQKEANKSVLMAGGGQQPPAGGKKDDDDDKPAAGAPSAGGAAGGASNGGASAGGFGGGGGGGGGAAVSSSSGGGGGAMDDESSLEARLARLQQQ